MNQRELNVVAELFESAEPIINRRLSDGAYLANTPALCPVRIGVEAWTADEARNRYARARREWLVLLRQPDKKPSLAMRRHDSEDGK